MANYRDCPIYATAKFKLLWMSNDALIVFVTTMSFTFEIDALMGLFVSFIAGLTAQHFLDKTGLPDGVVMYKIAAFSMLPIIRTYLPFMSALVTWFWKLEGSLAPPGYYKVYTR